VVATATSLAGSKKTDFRQFIYSCSSTNPKNMVKIGRVGVEKNGLAKIVKSKKK